MKLIVDIPEDVYTRLFDNGIQDNEIATDDICEMARSLRRGTPLNEVLDKITDEIQAMSTDYCGGYIGLDKQEVLKIIDKYRKEQE